jgi:hypothetical protein
LIDHGRGGLLYFAKIAFVQRVYLRGGDWVVTEARGIRV